MGLKEAVTTANHGPTPKTIRASWEVRDKERGWWDGTNAQQLSLNCTQSIDPKTLSTKD
jgi:hypothetical protein